MHREEFYGNNNFLWNLNDREILSLQMCDLDLSIENSFLKYCIKKVLEELKARNIPLKPHFWLSDEWFCPDGIVGIAIPFYLAHPRLIELEKNIIGYAEGASQQWCLKILRHELGHVIDNAFFLRRRKDRQRIFGKSSLTYPSSYTFKPYSRNYVRHIEEGYAQAHPAEDFAETFAVWLDPDSNWKEKYKNWPALKKLNCMDRLMKEISGSSPRINERFELDPLRTLKKTLKRHYQAKKENWGIGQDRFWDEGLKQFFSDSPSDNYESAFSYLKKYRREIAHKVFVETGYRKYMINRILSSLINRTKKLNLKVTQKELASDENLRYYLSKRVKQYVSQGRHLIAI